MSLVTEAYAPPPRRRFRRREIVMVVPRRSRAEVLASPAEVYRSFGSTLRSTRHGAIMLVGCTMFSVTYDQLVGDCRLTRLVLCRRYIVTRLDSELGWSSNNIARFMHRDHTSILNLLGRLPHKRKAERWS